VNTPTGSHSGVLTEEKQRSICTYRVEGQVVGAPTFACRGIGDREAANLVSSAVLSNDIV
jgi:hypothetical protein